MPHVPGYAYATEQNEEAHLSHRKQDTRTKVNCKWSSTPPKTLIACQPDTATALIPISRELTATQSNKRLANPCNKHNQLRFSSVSELAAKSRQTQSPHLHTNNQTAHSANHSKIPGMPKSCSNSAARFVCSLFVRGNLKKTSKVAKQKQILTE